MATELREMLTDCDLSIMRRALDEKIESLLRTFRTWTPELEATLKSYRKIGGYYKEKDFEDFARGK